MNGEGAFGGKDLSPLRRALILASVTLATTLYGTTVLVVSTVLPQMQGSLSATQDQIAWTMTFNIVATAIVTPMTGWLTGRFGRRAVMLWGMAIFGAATLGCGFAGSLETLVLFRVVQGAAGAPLTPLAQAITQDTYPRALHGTAMAAFGMGVVIGPAIGPVVGGYLTEAYNWRWAFFMVVPVAGVSWLAMWLVLTDGGKLRAARLDWTGFLALSIAVVCFQLTMDRGERRDWFDSTEILLEACLAGIGLYIFLAHSLTSRRPFLNLKLLLDRNYALGLCIVGIFGMLNFTPMVMLPPMLQDLAGFPNAVVGQLVAARGVGAILGFFLAMYVGKLDPRIGMTAGFAIMAASGWMMMQFDANATWWDVALVSWMQGVAVGVAWVPLTIATFSTVDPRYLAETSSVYHLMRNLGSSFFISVSVTVLIRTGGVNYGRLTEFVSPYNEALAVVDTGTASGLAALSGEIGQQAAMIGYLNAFTAYTAVALAALPLVLLMRMRR